MKRWHKTGLLAACLASWYVLTSDLKPSYKVQDRAYPISKEITVTETTFPTEEKIKKQITIKSDGERTEKQTIEKILKTENIDFSAKKFMIKTDRYTLVKNEDWFLSRVIGHFNSMMRRLYFWEWDISKGQDEERTKATLSMLENNKELKDITIRINHNEPLLDCYRLFTEDKLRKRNNVIARVALGIPTCIVSEIWAEFFRGDYYNPLTKTTVVYSNVESIVAHELGHHKDFQKFESDWGYALADAFFPVRLYKEWQASMNAKDIMSKEDSWQFYRFLLPAFLTYLIASYGLSKKLIKGMKKQRKLEEAGLSKKSEEELTEEERIKYKIIINSDPKIKASEAIRIFTEWNLIFCAGLASYHVANSLSQSKEISYACFAAGAALTEKFSRKLFDKVMPIEYFTLKYALLTFKNAFSKVPELNTTACEKIKSLYS